LLALWNTYSFFVTYATLDGFTPGAGTPPVAERAALDRWIISEVHQLVADVRRALDDYDPAAATRAVDRFVDDLSNWYVRRSRRRFWRSGDDRDKRAAYATLYEVLTTLARVLAPFVPFVAEAIYQNLVRSVDSEAPESVHLCSYPEADEALIDRSLATQVEQTRTLVSLGRAARSQAGVRVRQPLARLRVASQNGTAGAGGSPLAALPPELVGDVREELNVRQLEVASDRGEVVERLVRPRPDLLGPRLGRDFPRVLAALRAGEFRVNDDGSVEAGGQRLAPDEV